MGGEITGVNPGLAVAVEQELPEWKKFVPTLGKAGIGIRLGLKMAIRDHNIEGIDIDTLKPLLERFDEEGFNELSKDVDEGWLEPCREIVYLTSRMWCPRSSPDPENIPFSSLMEANNAVNRVSELMQPFLKPEEAK